MPVLSPTTGATQFTIADIAVGVIRKVENRQSDIATAYIWIRDALLEIAGNKDYRDEFDDLETYGLPANLTPLIREYNFSDFIVPGDYNNGTLDVLLWSDPPYNQQRRKLDMTHFQAADRATLVTQSASTPSQWYRFADTIGFDPTPNQAFQVQMRIMKRHAINDTNLDQTIILLPREWNEVLEWASAMRGFMELLEFEKAGEIRTMLYGDPDKPNKTGLIKGLITRRESEAWRQTKSLKPIVRSYCYGN